MADQERLNRGERSEGARREGGREGGRGGDREGGRRGGGGLNIRLSDNELRAARTIQDAFQLRSPVAVMGFCLRTMAELLEKGALDDVVAQQRAGGGRSGERGERGDRRGGGGAPGGRGPRPDPFARPSRPPAPAAAGPEVSVDTAAEDPGVEEEVAQEVGAEEVAAEEVAAGAVALEEPAGEATTAEASTEA